MARSKSFSSLVSQIAREAAREERLRIQNQRAAVREAERVQREHIRLQAAADKAAKQRYLEARTDEIDARNRYLQQQISELQGILEHTLKVDDSIDFGSLRIRDRFREFALPEALETPPQPPDREQMLSSVPHPSGLAKLIPGTSRRYEQALHAADDEYQRRLKQHEEKLVAREARIGVLRAEYDAEKAAYESKVKQRNQEVDAFESGYRAGDPEAVVAYCTMVLERSDYPDGFPQEFRLAYAPESKHLLIEYELPGIGVIPATAEYTYVKTKDTVNEKPRKATEVKALYQDIVAAVCLRTIHEVFEADQSGLLEVVTFNGFVQGVDPATGQDIRPHLASVRVTRQRFAEIDLSKIEKRACLRNLGAQVSSRPDELLSVKPVVEFNMVDRRFVEQSDVLSDLESRPNLMELSPFEFENLVSNLFEQMGFETKQTQASRDGGIDSVAFDTRPILGGKVVIQAKRYRNTVGVSAVRDLYGTMINEGANKGILATTSSYGPDAYDFSRDKPIELIDGGGLLYLLQQIGIEARIVFPED